MTQHQNAPTPSTTSGAIEVMLSWGDSRNDFDLDVDMPNGHYDVHSCLMEHFYVKNALN